VPPRKTAIKPQLRNVAALLNREAPTEAEQVEPSSQSASLDKIHLPIKQPRRFFDADKLAQLIASGQGAWHFRATSRSSAQGWGV
jgi:hypothetical protein